MVRPLRFWVIFCLACACAGARAGDFVPLATEIPLPEQFRGRPVWALTYAEGGELVVSVEGAVLVGSPSGGWKVLPAPDGPPAHFVSPGHGGALLLSTARVSLLKEGVLHDVPGVKGRLYRAESVEEGWLCGGENGVVLVRTDRSVRLVRALGDKAPSASIVRTAGLVVALEAGLRPHAWINGALTPQEFPATASAESVTFSESGTWLTQAGITGDHGEVLINGKERTRLGREAMLMGSYRARDLVYLATYNEGLLGYRPGEDKPALRWTGLGAFYTFKSAGTHLLAGTSQGAYTIADPDSALLRPLDGKDFLRLQATPEGVYLIRFGQGETILGARVLQPKEWFPGPPGTQVLGNELRFGALTDTVDDKRSFCFGIAVAGDTAAFCFRDYVELLGAAGRRSVRLQMDFSRIESDGRRFFVSTTAHGVQVIEPDGSVRKSIGQGQSRVRGLTDGRVILLFSNGDVRDSEGNLLGRTEDSLPFDVVLLDGRLAVLCTRANAGPVLRELDGGRWRPLEVPGLASVNAESLVTYDGRLYVAGRGGVLQLPLPLAAAAAPRPDFAWSAPVRAQYVDLPSVRDSVVTLTTGQWEPAFAPSTSFRVRIGPGEWTETRSGASLQIPVEWGNTDVTIVAERNLLRSEQVFTVHRPFPWWLRVWALPLHAGVFGGMVWLGVRWRTRRLAAHAKELEQRVAERTSSLVRSNAAKEEFLATVGHEIRNPLNGLVGITAMLQDADVGAREKNFLRVLAGCADQLRSMMDDILDFSRIERGQTVVTPAVFELVSLVEQSARVMDPSLTSCSLILPDHPAWFVGDSGKIRQIVCNLVSNALKYGQPSEAGVELRIAAAAPGQSLVRIIVRNTGPTIPAAELPHLFEPFRRGSTAGDRPGTGLGLAVCRRLALAMQGQLSAASAQGATEFTLELPLAQSHEPERTPVPEKPVSRALAIEDEHYNRLVLGHVLRELGYEVDWAPDGTSALRLASRQGYDLIVTDWRLPDLSGDELCRRLQRVLGEPRPPIIAVTAYTLGEKFDAARAAGMAGFVTKPVTREKLEQLIRGLAGGLSPRRSLDIQRPPAGPLAELGDLAPSLSKISSDVGLRWLEVETQARLHDPRTARTAHALRSLLLLAGEEAAAEQAGLVESAAAEENWAVVTQLVGLLGGEIAAVRARLKLG